MTTDATPTRLLQHVFAALAQGNARPLVDSLAPDCRWTVMGSTAWSGTYAGKPAILQRLLAPLQARMAGPMKTTAQRFIAQGDWVAVQASGDNITRSGQAYCNHYCFVVRVAGGRLQELTEYGDTALITQVLQAPP